MQLAMLYRGMKKMKIEVKSYVEEALKLLGEPKKSLGQNYLIDERYLSILSDVDKKNTLEIGGGLGNLTHYLEMNASSLDVVELDKSSFIFLKEQFKDYVHVCVYNENILKFDISEYEQIVGSLPYYITSDIIVKILIEGNCSLSRIMIQSDAYKRIFAPFGKEGYNPISILSTFLCDTKVLAYVSRNAFIPKPHVDSVILSLTFNHDQCLIGNKKQFYYFLKKCFLHPRKTILNNLIKGTSFEKEKIECVLNQVGIQNNLRPEDIKPKSYLTLYETLLKIS